MDRRLVIALGGGGFSEEPDNPLLDDFILASTPAERPRVCFVPTAFGDHPGLLLKFYAAFAERDATATHLPLFVRGRQSARDLLLAQDVIYVSGGNLANLLAVWRAHGIDSILREAWERGIVIAGLCAGAMCWFEGGISASFGHELIPLEEGLGFIEGSFCPHYDADPRRRAAYQGAVQNGFRAGFGVDDGAALVFRGAELSEIVSSRPEAGAHRIERDTDGGVAERALEVRFLGEPAPEAADRDFALPSL